MSGHHCAIDLEEPLGAALVAPSSPSAGAGVHMAHGLKWPASRHGCRLTCWSASGGSSGALSPTSASSPAVAPMPASSALCSAASSPQSAASSRSSASSGSPSSKSKTDSLPLAAFGGASEAEYEPILGRGSGAAQPEPLRVMRAAHAVRRAAGLAAPARWEPKFQRQIRRALLTSPRANTAARPMSACAAPLPLRLRRYAPACGSAT